MTATVFREIADAIAAELQATPAVGTVRDALAGPVPQSLTASITVQPGGSLDIALGVAYIDWRTDVHVHIEARQVSAGTSASQAVDELLGDVVLRLRDSNTELRSALAGLGVMGINLAQGDRRIQRDLAAADQQIAAATYTASVYHRTQGDGLTPWA